MIRAHTDTEANVSRRLSDTFSESITPERTTMPQVRYGATRNSPTDGRAVPIQSARVRDEYRCRVETISTSQYLRYAARKSGRNPISLTFEFLKLHCGRGRLTLQEYVQYGIYAPTLTEDEKRCFLGSVLQWPITRHCFDFGWLATTEDKWLYAKILDRSGVLAPPTLAVIDTHVRTWPGTRTLRTPAELRDFVVNRTREGDAVFGKVNHGIRSLGAFLILEGDHEHLHIHGEGWVSYETFLAQFVGDTAYLLQPRQRNHPFFARWTEHLATVRVYLLLGKGGGDAHIPFTVLKLPSADNIADNFWRPGNLVCALDPDIGTIRTARTKDAFGTTDHESHPVTGAPLVGETLPMWDRVLDLARTCAPIFPRIWYQSMDIAITEAGPLLVEINTGGSFTLPQFASGRGFLTDEVREFFRECGYAKV